MQQTGRRPCPPPPHRDGTRPARFLLAAFVLSGLLAATLPARPLMAQDTPAHADSRSGDASAADPAPGDAPAAARHDTGADGAKTDSHAAAKTSAKAAPAASAPASGPASGPAPAKPAAKSVTIAPDSLAAQLLGEIDSATQVSLHRIAAFGTLFADTKLVGVFIANLARDPAQRAAIGTVLLRLAIVVAIGLAAEQLLRLLMRRPLRRLGGVAHAADAEAETPDDAPPVPEQVTVVRDAAELEAVTARARSRAVAATQAGDDGRVARQAAPDAPALDAAASGPIGAAPSEVHEQRARDAQHRFRLLHALRRLPLVLLRLVLDAIPIAAFAAVTYVATDLLDLPRRSQSMILSVCGAYVAARLIILGFDVIFAPRYPRLRLPHMTDAFARTTMRWIRWLVILPAASIAFGECSHLLALPPRGVQAIVRLTVLGEHLLLAGLIWQVRVPVAHRLHPPRRLRGRPLGALLGGVADRWWIPALFLDFALWLVWAAQIHDGYAKMWRIFITGILVILAFRILAIALLGLLDRAFRIDPGMELRFPGLERRASRYYPVLRRIVTVVLFIAGAVVLLQAWGIPALGWFAGGRIGSRIISAALSILIAGLVGIVTWEVINSVLDRQIDRYTAAEQAARAARLKTLLPIIRTLLLTVLGVIAVLTVLSEIGVNVAPLLAGASIIGVAIGFGSQKLVQDFITGIFLLLENAMQVGDWVTVGGLSGSVEHLSVRTIRLRAGDGSVHIIPFSSVSTVTNTNRGRGNAAVSVDVAPVADIEKATEILNGIALEMREEETYRDGMLSDLQFWGVNSVSSQAVNLAGQIVCTDGARWGVQREFNRRMLLRFKEAGIPLATPTQALQLVSIPGGLAAPGQGPAGGATS